MEVPWTLPNATSYRDMVGPDGAFDIMSADQFTLLVQHGLREHHAILDVGCGCLRLGRLLIPYLLPDRYYGLEPDDALLWAGLRGELGESIVEVKGPAFITDEIDFDVRRFQRRFDYMIASSVFIHQPIRRVKACVEAAGDCMNRGGKFFASFRPGPRDFNGDGEVYPSTVAYRRRTMLALARSAGFIARILPRKHPRQMLWMMMTRR